MEDEKTAARDYVIELRAIAGAMRRKIQWPEEAAILEAAAALIERLMPTDNELAWAVEILNTHSYEYENGGGEWVLAQRDSLVAYNGETYMYKESAVRIAKKLDRRNEATP